MSDSTDPGPEATLAAEYVLGTLDLAEAEAATLRLVTDTAFAAEVAFWEGRLAPLALLSPPVAAPADLWTRIEDSTAGARASDAAERAPSLRAANDNRLIWWRAATFAGLAVAAGLAIFIALRAPPPRRCWPC